MAGRVSTLGPPRLMRRAILAASYENLFKRAKHAYLRTHKGAAPPSDEDSYIDRDGDIARRPPDEHSAMNSHAE